LSWMCVFSRHLHFFLSPTLRNCYIAIIQPELVQNSIGTRCPVLEDLDMVTMGPRARAPHLSESVRSCKALKTPAMSTAGLSSMEAPLHHSYPSRFVDTSRKLFAESPARIGHTQSQFCNFPQRNDSSFLLCTNCRHHCGHATFRISLA
jgi:hypothetical protein